jgi:flagellum-specific ATP synthase
MLKLDVNNLCQRARGRDRFRTAGKLRSATGVILSCTVPAAVGDQCAILTPGGGEILTEVIGFNNGLAYLVPYEQGEELSPGLTVVRRGSGLSVPVGDGLLGRIVDGLGRTIDGHGPLLGCEPRAVSQEAPAAMERARIRASFVTGQRALDGLLTLGRGQRVGIFAGSGVGKSTLLGEIAKGCEADVNVIALIGERGREVRPFLDDCVGPKGMEKSVVVVATCDQTPLMRVRASQAAITIADHYRAAGLNVMLMMDSLTRLAMAQRELGLALGEPPSARGYTPSCFQLLANTVERLGNAARGSITGILTVLVDGGDISISQSVSRVAHDVTEDDHRKAARKLREVLATYADAEDLIRIGAYTKGTSPQVDKAVELRPALLSFLKQDMDERTDFAQTRAMMERVAAAWPF